jgi:hypothetical protein
MKNNTTPSYPYRLWHLTDRTFFNKINDAGGPELKDEIHTKIDGGTQHSARAGLVVNSVDMAGFINTDL